MKCDVCSSPMCLAVSKRPRLHIVQTSEVQALLADGAGGFLSQPLVQAGFVELVLARHFAQACTGLQIFQTNQAPAAIQQRESRLTTHIIELFSCQQHVPTDCISTPQ
jgi:hypothetical protein